MVEAGRVSPEPWFYCLCRSRDALVGPVTRRQPHNPTDFVAACQSRQNADEKVVPLAFANHEISAVNSILWTNAGLFIRDPLAVDRHAASSNQTRRLAFGSHDRA